MLDNSKRKHQIRIEVDWSLGVLIVRRENCSNEKRNGEAEKKMKGEKTRIMRIKTI